MKVIRRGDVNRTALDLLLAEADGSQVHEFFVQTPDLDEVIDEWLKDADDDMIQNLLQHFGWEDVASVVDDQGQVHKLFSDDQEVNDGAD